MRVAAANTPAPLDSPHLLHYVPVLFQLGIEGRIAIVTDAGWNAVDATSAERRAARARTAKSCGPGALRSGAKFVQDDDARATVASGMVHRGEREISRKPLR